MFENIEKVIQSHATEFTEITITEDRNGEGFLLGMDVILSPFTLTHLYNPPLHAVIQRAADPETGEATKALYNLTELADTYPAFLYVHAASIEEGLQKLDEKAGKWLHLSSEEQKDIWNKIKKLIETLGVFGTYALIAQTDTFEIHNIKVSGDADTGPLLEITGDNDFQCEFHIEEDIGVITEAESIYWGELSSLGERCLLLKSEETGILISIPYSQITHINSCGRQKSYNKEKQK